MKELFFLALFVVSLAVPVTATELNEDTLNEPVSFGDTSVLVDPSDPAVTQDPVSDPAPIAEDEASDSAALASSDLSGGYYFVCDCDLGYDLKFYVPLEWASDVLLSLVLALRSICPPLLVTLFVRIIPIIHFSVTGFPSLLIEQITIILPI